MDVTQKLVLLGGMSPKAFAQRYWQKKPLLVRQALPDFKPLLDRRELFELAASEDVQSRLVINTPDKPAPWRLKKGPLQRRDFPPLKQPGWTVLIQSVDLHHEAVHALMKQFRFLPDARLDDLMISYASDGGGVGPHFDSYDVFLLQAKGCRRWRIGRQKDLSLQVDMPLKILAHFEPEQEFLLEPGDMLYLPPGYAHDGVAEGECMTYSIGFRSPSRVELARELMMCMAETADESLGDVMYRDPQQAPNDTPGEIPMQMRLFARKAVMDAMKDTRAMDRALGEYLTEPKPNVWFDAPALEATALHSGALVLDRRTRMMFDSHQVYVNGEAYLARGRDFTLMRTLANLRCLNAKERARLSSDAQQLLADWMIAGWVRSDD